MTSGSPALPLLVLKPSLTLGVNEESPRPQQGRHSVVLTQGNAVFIPTGLTAVQNPKHNGVSTRVAGLAGE